MKNETREKDMGFKKFLETVEDFKGKPYVKVGLPEEKTQTNKDRKGITNLELGLIHEFGTDTIPERSHIRAAYDSNLERLKKLSDKLQLKAIFGQISIVKALALIGEFKKSNIQKMITEGIEPSTGQGKTPLIDTGQYRSSFTYAVIEEDK